MDEIRLQNRGGKIPADQRVLIKERLLQAMSRTNIISASCKSAGISMHTFRAWVIEGFIHQDELSDALREYQDMIRGEIAKRAFVGMPVPLVRNGRIVYDANGDQVTTHVIDNKVLLALAQRALPEWKDQPETHHQDDGIPDDYKIVFDARLVSVDEWEQLKSIAQNIDDRTSGLVVES